MTITVRKLINELEKIENKFLEVHVYSLSRNLLLSPVQYVKKVDKKVLIFTEEDKLNWLNDFINSKILVSDKPFFILLKGFFCSIFTHGFLINLNVV